MIGMVKGTMREMKTVAGLPSAIASFRSNASGVNLSSLKVLVEAQQDLHGYDKPWAGGGGANKMPDVFNPLPANGALLVEYPSEISFTGLYISFVFSGKIGAKGGAFIQARDASNNVSATFTFSNLSDHNNQALSEEVTYSNELVHLSFSQTKAVKKWSFFRNWNPSNDASIKNFMLSIGNTAVDYAPYENICPITGWSGANVTRTGKNVWGGETMADDCVNAVNDPTYCTTGTDATGNYVAVVASWSIGVPFFSAFKANTRYTIRLKVSKEGNPANRTTNLAILYTDGTITSLSAPANFSVNNVQEYVAVSMANKTIKCIQGAYYSGTTHFYYDDCGVMEGVHTLADFVPYNGNTYTIAFGDTYYGCVLDVTSGVLRVDKAIVNLETLTWTTTSTRANSTSLQGIIKAPTNSYVLCGAIGEQCHEVKANTNLDTLGQFAVDSSGKLIFYRDNSMPSGNLVYPLATPIEIQLTPIQIAQLAENNVFADTGEVSECKYQNRIVTKLFSKG